MSPSCELKSVCSLSADIGADPLLCQANTGNISIKIDQILWIKASGKQLSKAREEDIMLPVDLQWARNCISKRQEIGAAESVNARKCQPSIETGMHAVLPARVIVHVHSVNAIAWAIRANSLSSLQTRLAGLRWAWIPYRSSGLPLALAIEDVIRDRCEIDVLILANHGLVVCGRDCTKVAALLKQVESRLDLAARQAPPPDLDQLQFYAKRSCYQVLDSPQIHCLATDPISLSILSNGVLYPCQAIFLGGRSAWLDSGLDRDLINVDTPFVVVAGRGTLVRRNLNTARLELLTGLAEVVQRIPPNVAIRYLTDRELTEAVKLYPSA